MEKYYQVSSTRESLFPISRAYNYHIDTRVISLQGVQKDTFPPAILLQVEPENKKNNGLFHFSSVPPLWMMLMFET